MQSLSLQSPACNPSRQTIKQAGILCDGIYRRPVLITRAWSAKKNPLAQPPRHVADRSAPQALALSHLANANDAPLRLLRYLTLLLRSMSGTCYLDSRAKIYMYSPPSIPDGANWRLLQLNRDITKSKSGNTAISQSISTTRQISIDIQIRERRHFDATCPTHSYKQTKSQNRMHHLQVRGL
jgi:hypothetical protein